VFDVTLLFFEGLTSNKMNFIPRVTSNSRKESPIKKVIFTLEKLGTNCEISNLDRLLCKKVFGKSSQKFELGGAYTFLKNSLTSNTFFQAEDGTQNNKIGISKTAKAN
jgi:hypothetical protein